MNNRLSPLTRAVKVVSKAYLKLGIPSISVAVMRHGNLICETALGYPDPAHKAQPTDEQTLYDLASVTKLFTATAFMVLCAQGKTALDQPVSKVLPAFTGTRPIQPYEDPLDWGGWVTVQQRRSGVDAGAITFRQLLTHSSGLPAWRPLFRQADANAAREMALNTFFSYLPGTDTVYSDIGLILTGLAIEALTGTRLDKALHQLVIKPLKLTHTRYLPVGKRRETTNVAATEWCPWRGRRVVGEVHDENAWQLGGVAGHAGLFSTARDLAAFGQLFLLGGSPLLTPDLVREMTSHQFSKDDLQRGIGFQLWSPDPEASSNPLGILSYGHTGFTGTSLWIDPSRETVIALLSNEVYRGRQERLTLPLRVDMHHAIIRALDRAE